MVKNDNVVMCFSISSCSPTIGYCIPKPSGSLDGLVCNFANELDCQQYASEEVYCMRSDQGKQICEAPNAARGHTKDARYGGVTRASCESDKFIVLSEKEVIDDERCKIVDCCQDDVEHASGRRCMKETKSGCENASILHSVVGCSNCGQ